MTSPYHIAKVPSVLNAEHPDEPPRYNYEITGPGLAEPRRYSGLSREAVEEAERLFRSIYEQGFSDGFTRGFGPRLITVTPEKGYLIHVRPLGERLIATCPSFEDCKAEGANEAELLQNAKSAILTAMAQGAKKP